MNLKQWSRSHEQDGLHSYQGLNVYIVYINDDPDLTSTYFTARSNLSKLLIVLIPDQLSGERLQEHWSSGLKNKYTKSP